MMTEEVKNLLKKKDQEGEPFHEALLAHAKRLIKMSRSKRSQNYDTWDAMDMTYRSETVPDVEDLNNERKGKPVKMVVPNTFAQCMTFASFLFLMFKQNRTFFQLSPTGDEDGGTKNRDSELLLERDLRHNEFNTKLFQHLLDIPRFGEAVLETCWTKKEVHSWVVPPPIQGELEGIPYEEEQEGEWQTFTKYEGNLINTISPYRFFPDTRHPLVDFQKGEFCAHEEEYSMQRLFDLQSVGEVVGVKHIDAFGKNYGSSDFRGAPTRWSLSNDMGRVESFDTNNKSSVALVTKMQIWIVPSEFTIGPGEKKLGKEEFPVLYHLWYANDNRIIRLEPTYYWHNEFSYCVAQYTPDLQQMCSLGLAEMISRLQEVVSWFINSHIRSVNRVIQNRNIVDPSKIDTKSLDGEGDIYLKKGVITPIDRAIMQLRVQDVTSGHMSDADDVSGMIQRVSGVSENMTGEFAGGRRSAKEVGVVTASGAGRNKMHGALIWETSLGRAGRLMLSNLRQSISFEAFTRAVGKSKPVMSPPDMITGAPPMELVSAEQVAMQRYIDFQGTPEDVICGDDYFVFDSTIASERGQIAASLQELLGILLTNPQAALQFDISPKALLEEIQWLRGAGNIGRFSISNRVAQGVEAAPPPMPLESPVEDGV